jgi:hypothetical protein
MTREVTVSISFPIELASGRVTKADRLIITPSSRETPGSNLDHLPLKPTVVEPAKLQATGAAIVRSCPLPRSSTPRDASAVDDAKTQGPRVNHRCLGARTPCGVTGVRAHNPHLNGDLSVAVKGKQRRRWRFESKRLRV